MNTTIRTIDPYTRLGTSYVLIWAGFENADEANRRDLILALDNVAASVGCAHIVRDEITLPPEELKEEFCRVIETIADVHADLHELVTDDFEEMLAIYLPSDCLKHVLAHKLWEKDPKNWARLLGLIISHLTENGSACRHITEVVRNYAAAV